MNIKRYDVDEIIRKWKAQQEPMMFLKQNDTWEVWLQVLEYLINE